jgi:RNA polymerase sigma-70 factor (ECF subfamily)
MHVLAVIPFHMSEADAEGKSLEDLDDIALMARTKRGDMDAFAVLVERHQHSVVGTVAKMLGNANDAEDVAQQVFVRVWKSAGRYEPTAKFTTWLMTITRNLVFNEMRRLQRSRMVSMETREEDPPMQFPDESARAPGEVLLEAEMEQAVDDAIASLPEMQRMALVLRRYEEMPYEEIAKVLETSVAATKSIIFRARNELRERLRKYLE